MITIIGVDLLPSFQALCSYYAVSPDTSPCSVKEGGGATLPSARRPRPRSSWPPASSPSYTSSRLRRGRAENWSPCTTE